MATENTPVTAELDFSLKSGERAVLHFRSQEATSVHLGNRRHPDNIKLVAEVPTPMPHGGAEHARNLLSLLADRAAPLNDKAPAFREQLCAVAQGVLEQEMAILGIKAQATELLREFAQTASLETEVMASFDKQQWVRDLAQDLADRINHPENYPNKRFNGLAEAAARCVLLYPDNPDAYAKLVGGITGEDTEVFLDSLPGMATLDELVRGLGDDHDYLYNPASGTVESQGASNSNEPCLVPESFLNIVRELQLDAAEARGKATPRAPG